MTTAHTIIEPMPPGGRTKADQATALRSLMDSKSSPADVRTIPAHTNPLLLVDASSNGIGGRVHDLCAERFGIVKRKGVRPDIVLRLDARESQLAPACRNARLAVIVADTEPHSRARALASLRRVCGWRGLCGPSLSVRLAMVGRGAPLFARLVLEAWRRAGGTPLHPGSAAWHDDPRSMRGLIDAIEGWWHGHCGVGVGSGASRASARGER